jgi:DNA topoisomerase-1
VSREEVAQARDLGTHPESGKPMSVRMGRFGPFVQIGTKDDEEKPRFAGLRPGQKMDSITHAEALVLFQLPRKLGTTAEGEEIVANTGRFGPYVKYGSKYVSLKLDDPYTVTLERALEVIREKQIADANRLILDFPDAGIQVLNGRFGPYITDKTRNAKIPKDREPKTLTLPECQSMLAAAPVRTFGKWGRKNKGGAGKAPAKDQATPPPKDQATPPPKDAPRRLAAKGLKSAARKRAPAAPSATVKPTTKPRGTQKPKGLPKGSPKG